jgi:hypothetical protein
MLGTPQSTRDTAPLLPHNTFHNAWLYDNGHARALDVVCTHMLEHQGWYGGNGPLYFWVLGSSATGIFLRKRLGKCLKYKK